ncbi:MULTISPECIES: cryptochrome/photolyase family protein [unclassified Pseudomonas]|uniref:cryptochrome/photolyase family protein n=1 Tax=unclassified Pseudomonas TaxID=196821 RepID=UPI002B22930A|nr:cryptochrome/photolyase family protein [Pseudomonas sp. CCC2.2]MEB0146075.1 cryptochrome/photolyase family protein [Pseudomonas sp. CCC2.2]
MRERGWNFIYAQIDEVGNSCTSACELRRRAGKLTAEHVHITESGEWRLEQKLREYDLPIVWHDDRRFLCSSEDFVHWAGGRAHLRMEVFYREMRKRTRLLLEPDGSPVSGVWTP